MEVVSRFYVADDGSKQVKLLSTSRSDTHAPSSTIKLLVVIVGQASVNNEQFDKIRTKII